MTNAEIIRKIMQWEGGFVNNPADLGGATNYGITKGTLEHFRGRPVTFDDLKNIPLSEVVQIYEQLYITSVDLDFLPDPLKSQMVDFAVCSGPAVAIRTLQDCLGVRPDGVMGPVTKSALALRDPDTINNALVAARVLFIARVVTKNPSQVAFLLGWLRRVVSFLV